MSTRRTKSPSQYDKRDRHASSPGGVPTEYDLELDRIGAAITPQPNGCWLWTGPKSNGYGRTGQQQAHRVVYEILVGPIPAGHVLHHECETPACCNPAHCVPMVGGDHVAHHAALRRKAS